MGKVCVKEFREVIKVLNDLKECLSREEYSEEAVKLVSESVGSIEYLLSTDYVMDPRYCRSLLGEAKRLLGRCRSGGLTLELMSSIRYFSRVTKAMKYRFTPLRSKLVLAYRLYLAGMITFFAIASFLGHSYLLPALIMIVPFFLALNYLRSLKSSGMLLAIASVPLPIVLGIITVNYCVYLLTHSSVSDVASRLHVAPSLATALVIGSLVAGLITSICLSIATYLFIRFRYAFT